MSTAVDLEELLGDPWDGDNPCGFEAVVAADEAGRLPDGGERILDRYGLGQEFVPAGLGGRLHDIPRLARTLRSVFRRDGALGLGYGVTSFMAAVNVWTSGGPDQQRRLADVLGRGGRAAVCFHELAHGNDLSRQEFRARRQGGGYLLSGRKEVVNNADRADALLLFARTEDAPGSRSHSLLLVERPELAGSRVRSLPRYPTVGVRGCSLGGLEFSDCPVPASSAVGVPGTGLETALRAFQVTRAALPSMAIGTLDTQLRVTLRFALDRRLYGSTVAELPHARAQLTGAFADLLVADCLATTATRALHLLPDECGPVAAATKYLVPRLLLEACDDLAVVLGARHYLREGTYGIFQKHLRDLPVLSLGHAGPTTCLATLVPQLHQLARRSWLAGGDPPPALFAPDGALPAMRFDRLALSAGGRDTLGGGVIASLEAVIDGSEGPGDPLGVLARALLAEFHDLAAGCAGLRPRERTVVSGPRSFALAERYALLLAASTCAQIWRHDGHGPESFLRDRAWLTAALHRICVRLGHAPEPLSRQTEDRLFTELLVRHESNTSFDLGDRPYA
ncbi:acyl-CoA dehydrogenase [Streptomyces sp. NPDC001930]|uniref:acyl-CoA dehydrogenase n=1 Tax=Streptomyces sp. NPDC001930 TaxID=3364625 RepID=UPI0036A6E632